MRFGEGQGLWRILSPSPGEWVASQTSFHLLFFLANLILFAALYCLTLVLSDWLGAPAGSGIKRILNGAAGAATLLGILHPTLVRSCFFTDGHLTRLARWVARTFHIAEDELRGAVSFPAWWSIGVGIALFIINLFLKSPKAGP